MIRCERMRWGVISGLLIGFSAFAAGCSDKECDFGSDCVFSKTCCSGRCVPDNVICAGPDAGRPPKPDAGRIDAGHPDAGGTDATVEDTGNVNAPPIARITFSGGTQVGSTFTFDGRASADPEGFPVSYRWSLDTRPLSSTATISAVFAGTTDLTPDLPGEYRVRLVVNDGILSSIPAVASVMATPRPVGVRLAVMNAPWAIFQTAPGMAVDGMDRVYVVDDDHVWIVDQGTVVEYMNQTDVELITGLSFQRFHDVDVFTNGLLYIMTDDTIIESDGPHLGQLHTMVTGPLASPLHMGLFALNRIGVISQDDGFFVMMPPAATSTIYSRAQFLGGTDCATQDLALARSGVFLYQPGCNGSPIVKGNLDGSGAAVLIDDMIAFPQNPFPISNFACSARDPRGGFFTIARGGSPEEAHLLHIDENATNPVGISVLSPLPSFEDVKTSLGETLLFDYCAMAVGPGGTIWVQSIGFLFTIN